MIAILLIWIFVFGLSGGRPGSFFNKSHNAIWIAHDWVGMPKTDKEIRDLVNQLNDFEIDTVFVHAGPFDEDGSIDPETYKYAINFIDTAKKIDSDIKYQAWLGQVRNKIDLSDSEIRHEIAKQSLIFAGLIGFDGIHFDIEPVWDEDSDFIEVLKETREMIPEDKIISVALAEFIPQSLIWFTANVHKFENFNSEVNYLNVAVYADQIVVMAYDTGINTDWLYRWLVKEQTIWLSNLLDGKELFVGIPAYEDDKPGFNPEVENIENGLIGIISGLNNIRSSEENFSGVAIYPHWELDDTEWQIYKDLWLK